jgi:hypothetical protein
VCLDYVRPAAQARWLVLYLTFDPGAPAYTLALYFYLFSSTDAAAAAAIDAAMGRA